MKSNQSCMNLIPFLIIIFSLCIIYAILMGRKEEHFYNKIERFQGKDPNQETLDSKKDSMKDLQAIMTSFSTNVKFTQEYANGTWTAMNSTVDEKGKVSNLMKIDITTLDGSNNSNFGTVTFPKNEDMGLNSETIMNIDNIFNDVLTCSDPNNKNLFIMVKFLNNFTDERSEQVNPMFTANKNEPRCIVNVYSNKKLRVKYVSYKIFNDFAGAELSRIIYSQSYIILEPKQLFNLRAYDIITGNYMFPPKYIGFEFGITPVSSEQRSAFDKIKNNYREVIQFSIKRTFHTPNGKEIQTKTSAPTQLNAIKDGQIPLSIKIAPLMLDKVANKLDEIYQPKSTIIYFYKIIKEDTIFQFGNSKMNSISQSELRLQNNSNSMFAGTIEYPKIDTVEKVLQNTYEMTYFKTVFNQKMDAEITIPFSDLYSYL